MSLPPFSISDALYGDHVLSAIETAKKDIFDVYKGPAGYQAINLFRTLDNMKSRTPFEPERAPWNREAPILSGPFECRQPVWDAFNEVLALHAPEGIKAPEIRAEWLKIMLVKALRYTEFTRALEIFKKKTRDLDIESTVISVDLEGAGEQVGKTVALILDSLIEKLSTLSKVTT